MIWSKIIIWIWLFFIPWNPVVSIIAYPICYFFFFSSLLLLICICIILQHQVQVHNFISTRISTNANPMMKMRFIFNTNTSKLQLSLDAPLVPTPIFYFHLWQPMFHLNCFLISNPCLSQVCCFVHYFKNQYLQ